MKYLVTSIHIINSSIQCGIFPEILKIAKVVPIYKSESKVTLTNFTPISLLVSISKILEICVKIQLTNYFNLNRYNKFPVDSIGSEQIRTPRAFFDITKYISYKLTIIYKVVIMFLGDEH